MRGMRGGVYRARSKRAEAREERAAPHLPRSSLSLSPAPSAILLGGESMNVTESYVSGARGMPQAKVPGRSHGNRGDRGSVRSPTGPDNILRKRPWNF